MVKIPEDNFRKWYAVAIAAMFFLSMVALFFIKPPEENRSIIDMCVGALVRDFISIITFYFKEKDNGSQEREIGD